MRKALVAMVMTGVVVAAWLNCTGCARNTQNLPGAGEPIAPAPAPAAAAAVRQIGSTTLLPLAQKWAEVFKQQHPEADIAVSGGGSGTGIKALLSKTAEIADASRKIKDEEVTQAKAAGLTPVEHLVAYDGIAVIVHPRNPLSEITLQKLSDLYSGQIQTWDEVGAKGLGQIQIVNRDSSSGTYEAFKEMVVQMHGKAKDRDFTPGTLNQTSNEAIRTLVAQSTGAIGYVGLGYLDDSVKVLKVIGPAGGAGVLPSVETVQSGKYPISRPLFCYTNGEPAGILKTYLDFIKSEAGQAIVRELGFVPTTKAAPAAKPAKSGS